MIPKSGLVFLPTLYFFLGLPLVLCQEVGDLQYEKGTHKIKVGEIKEERLLYWGKVKGFAKKNYLPLAKEICYPASAHNGQPNEHIKVTGYTVTDDREHKDEAVAFKVNGDIGSKQICFYFLTKLGSSMQYTVHVYGDRLLPLAKEPPIFEGVDVMRQPVGGEMFAEPSEGSAPRKKPKYYKTKRDTPQERKEARASKPKLKAQEQKEQRAPKKEDGEDNT